MLIRELKREVVMVNKKNNAGTRGRDPILSDIEQNSTGLSGMNSGRIRGYIDTACILIAIIAVEILLGAIVLKQSIPLLLVVLGLNLILAFVSSRLHPYFLFGIIGTQLIAGGLSSRMILAIEAVILFSALSLAIRKLLK